MFRTRNQCLAQRRYLEAARRDGQPGQFWSDVEDAAEQGEFREGRNFSIREAFCAFVDDGQEIVASWRPNGGRQIQEGGTGVQLLEAGVNTGDFANITGQIVYNTVLEAFTAPTYLADALTTTIPTDLSGEKIPGVSGIGDEAEQIGEAEGYPLAGVGEEWIDTPETAKRGLIVPVTKEAVFFDRTGLVMQRASKVAESLAMNKEKRVLDAVLGITSLYRRNGSSAIATYGDSSGAHDWDNLAASNGLTDYTDIEAALLLFEGMTDPNTGEPIVLDPTSLLIPGSLKMTAANIMNATEFRKATASAANTTVGPNPLSGYSFDIHSSPYVKARLAAGSVATTTWFIGDFKKAFAYMENWPITTSEAPPNNELEFTHDIVARWKVSERGTPAVLEPRCVVKNTA